MSASTTLWIQETKGIPLHGYATAAGEADDYVLYAAYASATYYNIGGKPGTYAGANLHAVFDQELKGMLDLVVREPAKAMKLWKAEYDARTPSGMNPRLWNITHVLAFVVEVTAQSASREPSSFSNPRGEPFLHHLRSGLFDQCQHIISQGSFLNEHPFFIWRMLGIVTAVCVSCLYRTIVPHTFKDCIPSKEDVLRMPAKLWQMASARRDIFLDGGVYDQSFPGSASKLRESLRYLLQAFCPVRANPQIITKQDLTVKKFAHLRRLALFAWFSGPSDGPEATSHADLMLEMACTFWQGHQLPSGEVLGVSDEEVLDFFGKDVIPVFTPVPFLFRLRATLEAAEGRDVIALAAMFRQISRGLLHPAFRSHLETSGVLELMMRGFKRMSDSSLRDTDDMGINVSLFPTVLPFLNGLSKDVVIDNVVRLLLCDYDVMLWISAGLLSTARLGAINTTNISDIIRTYQGIAQQLKRTKTDKVNYLLLTSSLRRYWYGTLATLYELQKYTYSSQRDSLIVTWRRFGIAAGVDEAAEKKDFLRHASKLCSWTSCPYHIAFSKAPTSTCKGCGEVRYCSRACQKRDWKVGGHKGVCHRLKDVPASVAK